MALPTNRSQLADYCLRELGEPIIKVNVTDDQISDRIDDAIALFKDFHFDGIEDVYLKHVLTEQNVTDGYIALPDSVLAVTKVMPFNTGSPYDSGIFDVRYQLHLSDLYSGQGIFRAGNLNYLETMRQYVSLLDGYFGTEHSYSYNRKVNRLYLNTDLGLLRATEGAILMKTYTAVGSTVNIYGDIFLREYTTALIKKQWGTNLKKFEGVTLLGGIKLDGQKIYDEGEAARAMLYEKLRGTYEMPVDFFIG